MMRDGNTVRAAAWRAALIAAILVAVIAVLDSGQVRADESALDGYEIVQPLPERVPWGEGEYLLFSIQYGLIYAGDATLEVRNIAVLPDSQPSYHVVSIARTNKAFDVVFKVRDRHESFIHWDDLYSLRFVKHLREGRFSRDGRVDFDQRNHLAVSGGTTVGIPPNTHDFLSALYYMRTIPIEPGQAVFLPNHTNGKNYPIYVKVTGRERVSVPAGEFDCLVVEPVLETSSIFEHKGKLTIWMTDDTVRMPVLLRSKVIVGAFEAVLKEFTLSTEAPRVLGRAESGGDGR
ncbi:MAG: DUF3108 domain-containing protein [Candidatus Krumholzibacteriota bacterium]|nr:DUF3108 domain-containing protein [Candidatus Krumholzibacteriota bacterium]